MVQFSFLSRRPVRRSALAMALACAMATAVTLFVATRRNAWTNARLSSAEQQLAALTLGRPDERDRAAIVWGYTQRLRLGLESPFRLIEAAARDPRLTLSERRTVSWALLSSVARGESHRVDAAALDNLTSGVSVEHRGVGGEQHLELIERAIADADDPRAAELALRFAYALASAERVVDGSAPALAAQAAALVADRELARRESRQVLRASGDPIGEIARRRARRRFYVERPVLIEPPREIEEAAIEMVPAILGELRTMRADGRTEIAESADSADLNAEALALPLYLAGARMPPAAPLVVTVRRYRAALRAHALGADGSRARNPEMLVAATAGVLDRAHRRPVARLLLAAAVAMRSHAQDAVWFPGDPPGVPAAILAELAGISFDDDVPASWRPYYLASLASGLGDLKRVLPSLRLDGVHVRFRVTAPADSALAMHDPRTRTLHLPIATAAGTITHELAHDLDRQSAQQQGTAGYRSDFVARPSVTVTSRGARGRVAASLRAMTEELTGLSRAARPATERPAEIFATRVDWFVAQALAREGIGSGFLSAVQDEVLTGHVVHPDRLRGADRSRSLLTALEGMTDVADFARAAREPTAQTLMRHVLALDPRGSLDVTRQDRVWELARPMLWSGCQSAIHGRAALVRLAAESRARGALLQRALRMEQRSRPAWARSALGEAPRDQAAMEPRTIQLTDLLLVRLAAGEELPAGVAAEAAPLAAAARCS